MKKRSVKMLVNFSEIHNICRVALVIVVIFEVCCLCSCKTKRHEYGLSHDKIQEILNNRRTTLGDTNAEVGDFDPETSYDPDTDRTTWYTEVPNDCSICHGSGICSMCGGAGSFSAGYGFSTNCINCQGAKVCPHCKGKATKKQYKDIAIGSSNWDYSEHDKLREAEKAMMRTAFKISKGKSADPENEYTYTEITDGFKETFTHLETLFGQQFVKQIFTYSVYRCPSCHGEGCEECYNGYAFKNSAIEYIGQNLSATVDYLNGQKTNYQSYASNSTAYTPSPSIGDVGSSSSSSSSRYPRMCTMCHGKGTYILPDMYPLGETDGVYFCNDCGQNIRKIDYHHHKWCSVCRGDGTIDGDE